MKILKVKNIIGSLIIIGMATAFLSSCAEKDMPKPESLQTEKEPQRHLKIFLPQSVDTENQDAIEAFIKNISPTDLKQYQKDAVIHEYLSDLNKTETIINDYKDLFESYSDVNLSNYITDIEIELLEEKLHTIKDTQINSRQCLITEIEYFFYDWCCNYVAGSNDIACDVEAILDRFLLWCEH